MFISACIYSYLFRKVLDFFFKGLDPPWFSQFAFYLPFGGLDVDGGKVEFFEVTCSGSTMYSCVFCCLLIGSVGMLRALTSLYSLLLLCRLI